MTPLSADEYKQYEEQIFRNSKVEIDGCWFDRCHFVECVMIFRGSAPFHLTDCTFDNITLYPDDDAEHLIQCLAIAFPDADILRMLAVPRIDLRRLRD